MRDCEQLARELPRLLNSHLKQKLIYRLDGNKSFEHELTVPAWGHEQVGIVKLIFDIILVLVYLI